MISLFESKRNTLLQYADFYDCVNFIETGTGSGDMTDALYPFFHEVYSIELAKNLFQHAKMKFSKLANIHLYHGDSGEILATLPEMKGWSLYFLDAHFSGEGTAQARKDTPILEELTAILSAKSFRGVIIIDDLKEFNGSNSYPLLTELEAHVQKLKSGLTVEIIKEGGGMIAIYPTKKKRNLENTLVPMKPKYILAEPISAPEATDPQKEETHERPPMLYGPNR